MKSLHIPKDGRWAIREPNLRAQDLADFLGGLPEYMWRPSLATRTVEAPGFRAAKGIPQVSATIGGLAGTLWPAIAEPSQRGPFEVMADPAAWSQLGQDAVEYGRGALSRGAETLGDVALSYPRGFAKMAIAAPGDTGRAITWALLHSLAGPEAGRGSASNLVPNAGSPFQYPEGQGPAPGMTDASNLTDDVWKWGDLPSWESASELMGNPTTPAGVAAEFLGSFGLGAGKAASGAARGLGRIGENLAATGGLAPKGRAAKQSGVLYLDMPTAKNLRPFYDSDSYPLYVAPPGQPIAMSDMKSVVLPEGAQHRGTLTRNARALATPDQAVWLWPENAALHYDVFKDVYGDRAALFKKAMAEGKPLDTAFLGMDDLADFWSASKHGQLYGLDPESISAFRTWARLDRQGAARDFGMTKTGRAGRIPEMLRGDWESMGVPKWERGAVNPAGLKPYRKVPPMKTAAWDDAGRTVYGDEDIRAYGEFDNHPALAKYKLYMNPGSKNYTAGFYLPDEDKILDRSMTSQYLMDRLGMAPVGTQAGQLGQAESWTTGAFANVWNTIDAETKRALWREAMDFQRVGAVPTDQNIQYIANALGLSSPEFVQGIGLGDLGFGADRLGEVLYGILHP